MTEHTAVPSLILEQLIFRDRGVLAVNSVSLEVCPGELFVLLGPQGSGTSAVLRIAAGLLAADSGRVLVHGRDLTSVAAQQRGLGYLSSRPALFNHMTVADNIAFGLRLRKVAPAEVRATCQKLLELVELNGLDHCKPYQLTHIQRQRVALARALAYQPHALLLDAPLSALQPAERMALRATLLHIHHEFRLPVLLATSDPEDAFALAERVGVMNGGRLLEVGTPSDLYQRPRTEFTATLLGPANLLVGQLTHDIVQLGALQMQLPVLSIGADEPRRVPVLFRPEEVAVAPAEHDLEMPALGYGAVERVTYLGAAERLWIRLPPLPGVRTIAPLVPFGAEYLLVEATRSAAQAQHFRIAAGDRVWVGVRSLHAIVDGRLRFLIVTGATPAARAALAVGRQIGRLAQAQTRVIEYATAADNPSWSIWGAYQQLRNGLAGDAQGIAAEQSPEAVLQAAERDQYDLVVLAAPERDRAGLLEPLLLAGKQHVLLVPGPQPPPQRALICVATGEPSKHDVLVAGRLLRHFGAEATLLAIMPKYTTYVEACKRAEQFLSAGARTLALLGVPTRTAIRTGAVQSEILAELTVGSYDLLVLGAPLPSQSGRSVVAGVVGELLSHISGLAVLLVRSPDAIARVASVQQAADY
jgi:ABC-type sulfate/molybdate transport systems ATPase subunit/nucleotide-binding universal stress UspA family protein